MNGSRYVPVWILLFFICEVKGQDFPAATGFSPERGVFGAGVIVGEPTGLSAKYWTSSDKAWDFAFGASFFTDFRLHATRLWHIDVFDNQRVPLHYGIGVSLAGKSGRIAEFRGGSPRHRDRIGIGIRGSVGVSYLVPTAPFDLFAEIGGVLVVFPPAALDIDLSVGVRYYF